MVKDFGRRARWRGGIPCVVCQALRGVLSAARKSNKETGACDGEALPSEWEQNVPDTDAEPIREVLLTSGPETRSRDGVVVHCSMFSHVYFVQVVEQKEKPTDVCNTVRTIETDSLIFKPEMKATRIKWNKRIVV